MECRDGVVAVDRGRRPGGECRDGVVAVDRGRWPGGECRDGVVAVDRGTRGFLSGYSSYCGKDSNCVCVLVVDV